MEGSIVSLSSHPTSLLMLSAAASIKLMEGICCLVIL